MFLHSLRQSNDHYADEHDDDEDDDDDDEEIGKENDGNDGNVSSACEKSSF